MKSHYIVTYPQLFIASLLIGIVAGGISVLNTEYQNYTNIPVVEQNPDGECLRVLNFENGHAFNCNDVGMVLRQYRTLTVE